MAKSCGATQLGADRFSYPSLETPIQMKRRMFIQTGLSFCALSYFSAGVASDFGASKGFPGGWPPLNERGGQPLPWVNQDYLVNNMSGGMEPLFKHAVVKASSTPSILTSQATLTCVES